MIGEVVRLDRKLPLVELDDGRRVRCEHSADVKKYGSERAAIGDIVEVELPDGHDVGVITAISPRRTTFVRRDPTERMTAQVLAANFNRVVIVQPINALNMKRLERELVLAHETGAAVAIILTKADFLNGACEETTAQVRALAGCDVPVFAMSKDDGDSIECVREFLAEGTSVLIGRSGVGKSTLVNILIGEERRAVSEVRANDGKGRHTTVSREIIELPPTCAQAACGKGGGRIVDMPGVRGLGLWDANEGISAAFADIEKFAAECRFRDCKHKSEPGCAVRAAVEKGLLSEKRLESYLGMQDELASTACKREQSHWKNK